MDFWVVARASLISGMQTYAAICILLADNRPKRLMLQAGILNRSLLETLGNVLALCEARRNAREFCSVGPSDQQLFGNEDKWKDYLSKYAQGLRVCAQDIRVSRE